MNVVLATLNAKYIHTNLALRLLKAYCGEEFPVEIAEYTIKDPTMNIVTDLFGRRPDVLGFSCYIWNIEETLRIVELVKKVFPDVLIVLGGPEVSYDADIWLKKSPAVDFIVMGEGEEPFRGLLRQIRDERKWSKVDGIAFRDGGHIRMNPAAVKLDLDDIPSPYRFPDDALELGSRIVYFETSRGCPFNCQFCLSSIETGVRYFDIERTKADILYLVQNGAKTIKFVDRTFNIKRDYALEMFDFLIKNHGGCVFQFEITADIMRPEVLQFLAENAPPGIFRFEIGVQSTNETTNELVKRKQNFAKLCRTVNAVKESGKIDQHLDLIAGLPGEDYTSFKKTFNDVFALRPEELQLGFLKMLRGTGLRREADKYGYVYMDHPPYEILGNEVLPFADIVRIKRTEDMLEKYWNDHRLDYSVTFLIEQVFATPFDFFQEFGDYAAAEGWRTTGHQLEDLFGRLYQFLAARGTEPLEVAEGLMKLDYYLGHKYKPRKIWWESRSGRERHTSSIQLAVEHPERFTGPFGSSKEIEGQEGAATGLGLLSKDLSKHAMVEVLPFDLELYRRDKRVDSSRSTVLLVVYPPGRERAECYTFMLDKTDC
ncbi:B12-binding domain-containing radical SAM protein [Gorillibacterium timonense]|uniref:B12-binding domain-containing radical SAM protein n=1 Tax=Gorillibacterium timonense TaxID=1689269 RepID=UPI00071DAFBF|nr:B12-binding domain-containing radical SAM protein [Gorillibacterium timonense]